MKKILLPALIVVLVIGLVIATSKNTIARVSIEKGVQMATGLRLTVADVNVGVFTTLIGITDLNLFNPPQFEDKVMLDMPEVYVDYNLPEIIKGKIHLNELRIHMKEFAIIKNAKGELNLNSLAAVKQQKQDEAAPPKKKGKMPEIQIDKLDLKIGKVVYKDYSKGGAPQVQEFNVNINEQFQDINDPNKLVSVIVVKALSKTTIARLANFDVKGLQDTITGTLGSAQKIVGDLAGTSKSVADTASQVKTVVQDTAETTKTTVQELAGALKMPFGSNEE